ncbi:MAG TPA: pitrilysin family protein [Thermodesulfobacteriota bacterium]|nr:pitrilysin family protein [Thermodesulfobacteriota bacterium]
MTRYLRTRTIYLSLVLFLLFATISEAGLKENVFETLLPNGLKVILLENHKAPLVTFQVWYRVGSRNEAWGKTGLSHMLEHMMFKGTEKVGPEEFSRIIQENGGNDNAFTSRDYTAYFENISADRVQVSIDLESDRMQNLLLREQDFRTERMVVMEERRLRTEDNPQANLQEHMEATAFLTSPYHWPTIGWKEDIERFTLDDLKAHYRTYYNSVNAILIVVGDFKREELLPRIEKAFGSMPKGIAPNQERDVDPKQTGERRVFVKKEAQLPYIVMGYHVPNLREPDSYVLEVIATLLSAGKSSRLYQSLVREKRLVLSVDADHSLLSRDPSLFYLSAELLPGKEVADVEKALDQEVERLKKELVGAHELEKAKNQIEASFIFSQDSLFYQAMLVAQHEIAVTWRAIDDYLPSIRKVSPEEIQRVAKKYLTPDNRTVGVLIPLPPKEGKPVPEGPPTKERMIR